MAANGTFFNCAPFTTTLTYTNPGTITIPTYTTGTWTNPGTITMPTYTTGTWTNTLGVDIGPNPKLSRTLSANVLELHKDDKKHAMTLDYDTVDKLLQTVKRLENENAKLRIEFQAIKDHLAQRSTSLQELENVVTELHSPTKT